MFRLLRRNFVILSLFFISFFSFSFFSSPHFFISNSIIYANTETERKASSHNGSPAGESEITIESTYENHSEASMTPETLLDGLKFLKGFTQAALNFSETLAIARNEDDNLIANSSAFSVLHRKVIAIIDMIRMKFPFDLYDDLFLSLRQSPLSIDITVAPHEVRSFIKDQESFEAFLSIMIGHIRELPIDDLKLEESLIKSIHDAKEKVDQMDAANLGGLLSGLQVIPELSLETKMNLRGKELSEAIKILERVAFEDLPNFRLGNVKGIKRDALVSLLKEKGEALEAFYRSMASFLILKSESYTQVKDLSKIKDKDALIKELGNFSIDRIDFLLDSDNPALKELQEIFLENETPKNVSLKIKGLNSWVRNLNKIKVVSEQVGKKHLVIEEISPVESLLTGSVGCDCSTTLSAGYAFAPSERIFFVRKPDRKGNGTEDIGYIKTIVGETIGGRTLYIQTINGEFSTDDVNSILNAFIDLKEYLQVNSISLAQDYDGLVNSSGLIKILDTWRNVSLYGIETLDNTGKLQSQMEDMNVGKKSYPFEYLDVPIREIIEEMDQDGMEYDQMESHRGVTPISIQIYTKRTQYKVRNANRSFVFNADADTNLYNNMFRMHQLDVMFSSEDFKRLISGETRDENIFLETLYNVQKDFIAHPAFLDAFLEASSDLKKIETDPFQKLYIGSVFQYVTDEGNMFKFIKSLEERGASQKSLARVHLLLLAHLFGELKSSNLSFFIKTHEPHMKNALRYLKSQGQRGFYQNYISSFLKQGAYAEVLQSRDFRSDLKGILGEGDYKIILKETLLSLYKKDFAKISSVDELRAFSYQVRDIRQLGLDFLEIRSLFSQLSKREKLTLKFLNNFIDAMQPLEGKYTYRDYLPPEALKTYQEFLEGEEKKIKDAEMRERAVLMKKGEDFLNKMKIESSKVSTIGWALKRVGDLWMFLETFPELKNIDSLRQVLDIDALYFEIVIPIMRTFKFYSDFNASFGLGGNMRNIGEYVKVVREEFSEEFNNERVSLEGRLASIVDEFMREHNKVSVETFKAYNLLKSEFDHLRSVGLISTEFFTFIKTSLSKRIYDLLLEITVDSVSQYNTYVRSLAAARKRNLISVEFYDKENTKLKSTLENISKNIRGASEMGLLIDHLSRFAIKTKNSKLQEYKVKLFEAGLKSFMASALNSSSVDIADLIKRVSDILDKVSVGGVLNPSEIAKLDIDSDVSLLNKRLQEKISSLSSGEGLKLNQKTLSDVSRINTVLKKYSSKIRTMSSSCSAVANKVLQGTQVPHSSL